MTTRTLFTATLVLLAALATTNALQCYDCFGTGPDHKECSLERTCKGVACMIFDAGDNKTASAFCLLAMKGQKMEEAKDGCWLEPDGKGKHCMCFTDFCNKLVDRRNTDEADPMAPLLPTAEFLKQNPLVDYDTPNLGGDYVDEGSHPAPNNVLYPSADKQDPRVAGVEDEDDDLVPVGFADYEAVEEKRRTSTKKVTTTTTTSVGTTETPDGVELPHDTETNVVKADDFDEDSRRVPMSRVPEDRRDNEISSGTTFKPPSWMLFVFPMAASWARFWTSF